ncbi:MAG: acyltransferase family protein, partial [Bacteroidota bacterium]
MSRSVAADGLKSLAIFGVVYIHASFLLGCNSEEIRQVFNEFFRFAVPVFVICWAFFFERGWAKRDEAARWGYLREKFLYLFRVYLIWSVFYFFLLVNWDTITPRKVLTTHFMGYGWSGQYYFIILFQLMLLFPLIRWVYNHKVWQKVAIGLMVGFALLYSYRYAVLPPIVTKIGSLPFAYWVTYVFAGIAIARTKDLRLPYWLAASLLLIPFEF